ncbi:MAG: endo-1,4-beta-xylanase [Terrimicrobiaceae bacterium]
MKSNTITDSIKFNSRRMLLAGMAISLLAGGALTARAAEADSRDDNNPWGVGAGAEWMMDFPKFNPLLNQAGVKWIRFWYEWQGTQPKQGEWKWEVTDKIVADAKTNDLHVVGIWHYFAPWTSADGGTRKGPVKDMQFWKDYVAGSVERYKADVKYWEVWNEFNGSFYQGSQGTQRAKEYADLVVAAYDTAKKIDPNVKIGLSVANFDVNFLDEAIKAGAGGHFDFICVHPYENLGAVADGGEVGYLSLTGNLREMLKANKQDVNTPLWITEIGAYAPIKPDPKGDAKQADMLAKAYILSIVQGFQRIFWFEARGPAYGKGTDLSLIRADWSLRPSYDALKTMTTVLGAEPKYLGWLDIGKGGYGFAFKGKTGDVLAAWALPDKENKTTFSADVKLVDLAGKETPLAAGKELTLTNSPVLITGLPADLTTQAQANLDKPYPWGGDYAKATQVTCLLGATNREDGLKQADQKTTVVVNDLTETWRRTDISNPALNGEGNYVYFRVDPLFVPFGTKNLEITVVARRLAPDKQAGTSLTYESTKGYVGVPEGWWTIPEGDGWHEHTWKVSDANFVGQWGWNFRLHAIGTPNDFLIKEVRVRKAQ